MSYPIRHGIWFKDKDDFDKVVADLEDTIDGAEEDKLFIHWESYKQHDVEVFENIAKKYPEMTCMGYSEYCGMGGGTSLSITVNRGHVDIQEACIVDDPSVYGYEEEDEIDMEEKENKPNWDNEEFDEDQKKAFNKFIKDIDFIVQNKTKIKAIYLNLEEYFEKSKTAREAKMWADIQSRFRIIKENAEEILDYDDIINPVQAQKVTVTIFAKNEEEAKAKAYRMIGARNLGTSISPPF